MSVAVPSTWLPTTLSYSAATLAALKALTTVPVTVTTGCRTTAGDEGGGVWVFRTGDRSASVSLDTRSGVWAAPDSAPTGSSGAWQRIYSEPVNVRWFGATGDGSTDDAAAFVGAFAVATSVFAPTPTSTYKLSSNITATGKILEMEGTTSGVGQIIDAMMVRTSSTSTAFGKNGANGNSGGPYQGLQIGGGNPTMGTAGVLLYPDGHSSLLTHTPTKNESPLEMLLYNSGAQGKCTTNNGGNTVTWVSGTTFDAAWIGKRISLGASIYKVATVPSGTSMTVTTTAGGGVTFSGTPTVTFQVVYYSGTGTCNVSGSTVTRLTGDPFWPYPTSATFEFTINGTIRAVASFDDIDTYTLSAPPGDVTGATYVFYDVVNDQSTTMRLQRIIGSNEENHAWYAKYDGYHFRSLISGSGTYGKIFIGSGDNGGGTLYNQFVAQTDGGLTLIGDTGSESIRLTTSGGVVPVNRFEIQPAPTGFAPTWRSRGSDTDVGMGFDTQGAGGFTFSSHSFNAFELQIFAGNAAAWLGIASHATDPFIVSQGATDSTVYIGGKGTGGVKLVDGGTAIKFQCNTTGIGFYATSPVAKPTISGSVGGNAAVTSIAAALATLGLVTNSTS